MDATLSAICFLCKGSRAGWRGWIFSGIDLMESSKMEPVNNLSMVKV